MKNRDRIAASFMNDFSWLPNRHRTIPMDNSRNVQATGTPCPQCKEESRRRQVSVSMHCERTEREGDQFNAGVDWAETHSQLRFLNTQTSTKRPRLTTDLPPLNSEE